MWRLVLQASDDVSENDKQTKRQAKKKKGTKINSED